MERYYIWMDCGDHDTSIEVQGAEAAWEAYRRACQLVEYVGGVVQLLDAGDIAHPIATFNGTEED